MDDSTTKDHGGEGARRRGLRARMLGVFALLLVTAAGGVFASSGVGGRSGGTTPPLDPLAFEARGPGGVQLTGRLDRGSVLRGSDGAVRMELILAADDAPRIALARVPTDLLVVLDRSGSMGGKPLGDAIASVQELIARLGAEDRFALVTYASDARLAIPMQVATAQNRRQWQQHVGSIQPGGGTNMAAGMDLATATMDPLRRAGRAARVILLSDGHANEGDHSPAGLRARAAHVARGEYVLSTVGVGLDFDESLMAALADSGTGNFYYVRDGRDLGDVFAGEFDSARETVASALAVEIELAPGVELLDAAGYPLERDGRIARFRPGALFAGQSRHVWLTFSAPTAAAGDLPLGDIAMTYRTAGQRGVAASHRVRFARTLEVACVEGREAYVAALDPETAVRSLAEDGLASLKQKVARAVSSGDYDDARVQIDEYRQKNEALGHDLGIALKDMSSFGAAAELEEQVLDASRSRSPQSRKALSKKLSAEGQDGRRVGAKH